MRETFSRSALLLLAGLAVALPARSALAQPAHSAADVAQARELFNQAMDLRDKGDATGALEKFRSANALAGTPITGAELGRTYAALGKLVEAREAFLSVQRLPLQPQETLRSKAARKESAELAEQIRARIPSLTIQIAGAPAGTVAVTVDGAAVPAEALVSPRLVNPGSHKVAATTAAGGNAEATVEVKEGETRTVELTLVNPVAPPSPSTAQPAPGLPETPPPAATSSSGFGPLVYVGFGVAAAGVVAGGVTGALSLSDASSVKGACTGTLCPTSVDGKLHTGRTLGDVSTISFAVAGAGAVVGVIGLLVGHHATAPETTASVTPWIGPGSAGVSGTF